MVSLHSAGVGKRATGTATRPPIGGSWASRRASSHEWTRTLELLPDGQSARPIPPGVIVRSGGSISGSSGGRLGERTIPEEVGPVLPVGPEGEPQAYLGGQAHAGPATNPLPITRELLERSRERFNIYCAPCHSPVGDGDGMVARRGFPHPPFYHTERLRQALDAHFFAVITRGYGAMYSYADRVNEHDRWARP